MELAAPSPAFTQQTECDCRSIDENSKEDDDEQQTDPSFSNRRGLPLFC